MATKLDLAEAQLLGYFHRKNGNTLFDLLTGMGLTQKEWEKLKSEYGLEYLTESEKLYIDKLLTNP